MRILNLPSFDVQIRENKGKKQIFDVIRKKYVALTPEEWVRQHFINYMVNLGYPASLMAIERMVIVNGLKQRADIVLHNRKGEPALIVECKAPEVTINNDTLAQAARYNIPLNVDYLVVTNGLTHYCIRLDKAGLNHEVLRQLPDFDIINAQE
ncbi:MAG TPA: restriction endonuclease subunit R [Marinilabiliaceae bacterium]|nr:restriction endonuclease subunit R [Marinilabiliaceae bacterium]HBX88720.1 restriction endonuclease subunit R [Marinilabiliaceae bacterium]